LKSAEKQQLYLLRSLDSDEEAAVEYGWHFLAFTDRFAG
jgi:hypothetical protein